MLLLKYLLVGAGITMFVVAAGILTYDLYLLLAYRRVRLAPPARAPHRTRAPPRRRVPRPATPASRFATPPRPLPERGGGCRVIARSDTENGSANTASSGWTSPGGASLR